MGDPGLVIRHSVGVIVHLGAADLWLASRPPSCAASPSCAPWASLILRSRSSRRTVEMYAAATALRLLRSLSAGIIGSCRTGISLHFRVHEKIGDRRVSNGGAHRWSLAYGCCCSWHPSCYGCSKTGRGFASRPCQSTVKLQDQEITYVITEYA